MAFNPNKYPIERRYIQKRSNTRSGAYLVSGSPQFFVAHDTGNEGATADGHFIYFNGLTDRSASAQTFIDDVKILEIIPTGTGTDRAEKAWHVIYDVTTDNSWFGDDANDVAIGVELCYGVAKNGKAINFKEAYARYVWYFAFLCYKFNKGTEKIIGHEHLDPKRKIDPSHALNKYGVTYAQFIEDVKKELKGEEELELDDKVADYILIVLSDYWHKMNGNSDVQEYTHFVANELRKALGRPTE
jgi:N-acetylmuramoyl-L-alanine amidase CwlA